MFGQVPQPQFCVSHLFSGIFPPINAGWSWMRWLNSCGRLIHQLVGWEWS